MARSVPALGLCLALVAPARALDITACDQRVPDHEHAVLQLDLNCSGPGTCLEDPSMHCDFSSQCPSLVCERGAVNLGKRASLDLNGHSIATTRVGVFCVGRPPCYVTGPGRLVGGDDGILGRGSLVVTDVDIEDSVRGLASFSPNGLARATRVTIRRCQVAIDAQRIRATDVSVQDGTPPSNSPPCSGFCAGAPSFGVVRGSGVTIIDGPVYGIASARIILEGSTITGNSPRDLISLKRPILIDSICGRSEVVDSGGTSWGVCTND